MTGDPVSAGMSSSHMEPDTVARRLDGKENVLASKVTDCMNVKLFNAYLLKLFNVFCSCHVFTF